MIAVVACTVALLAGAADAELPRILGCPYARAPHDHPEPRWMELFLRLPHDEKRAKWDSLSAEQQVELGALTRLITCNNLDATEWHFRVEDEWQRTLPVLRQAIASEKSDPVVVVLAELLAHISYAKHDLRGDSELLERLERRIRRIKDPTAKWYAGEYLDWIREHRASFAPPIDP